MGNIMPPEACMPPVTLIVLNWNGRHLLNDCLSALTGLDYPAFTIILVDNASNDDSVTFVRNRFPHVTIYENAVNLGYTGGYNAVLRNLASEFVVLVNPDVVVTPGWLRALIAPFLADARIGITGCKLYYPGRHKLQHAGGTIVGPRALPRHYGGHTPDVGEHDLLRDVDYVTGAAQAIRRALLDEIGLLDEGYFLYYEDVDLCVRARRAGYRVVYVPDATAVHDESSLSHKGSDAYLRLFHSGRWRYLLKHSELDTLCRDAAPAEQAWLAAAPPAEREAAKQAYRLALAQLAEIWAARARDGAPAATAVQQQQVIGALESLRQAAAAWTFPAERLATLREKALVVERPLRSPTPLVGPLFTSLRRAWYSLAEKWYVRDLRQQQNEVNRELAQALSASAGHLRDQAARRLAQDNDLLALERAQAELRQELARTETLLTAVETRLAQLEQNQGSE
jgi:GT2 family glycosyltransferase